MDLKPIAPSKTIAAELETLGNAIVRSAMAEVRREIIPSAILDRQSLGARRRSRTRHAADRTAERVERLTDKAAHNAITSLAKESARHTKAWAGMLQRATKDANAHLKPQDVKDIVMLRSDVVRSLFKDVADEIVNGTLREAASWAITTEPQSELRQGLRDIETKARKRVEIIASDQAAKLSAAFTEARSKQSKIKKYRWVTMKDNRVRHAHRDRHGKTFEWSKPPTGGHPGEDYNCRCKAVPIIEGK